MSLLFNMLSRFVIAFLPRSKCLLISWLQSPSTVILKPKKIKSITVFIVSPSICYEVIQWMSIFNVLCWSISSGYFPWCFYQICFLTSSLHLFIIIFWFGPKQSFCFGPPLLVLGYSNQNLERLFEFPTALPVYRFKIQNFAY